MSFTEREKRTLRRAAVGVSLYLICFLGWKTLHHLEASRADYQRLAAEAQRLKRELQPYENRVLLTQKLKEAFHLDPQKLSRATLVAEASAAIQKAAASGGIAVGPIRETPSRASARDLASMQLEGVGPVPAVMALLNRLETIGYPLIVDTIQFNPDPMKPGMLKIHLTITILNYDQWKNEERPHA